MYISAILVGFFVLILSSVDAKWDWNTTSPLDEYVNRPDSNYRWEYVAEYDLSDTLGCVVHMVNMTSQKWKDESISNHAIWWHHMAIAIPNDFDNKEHGLIFIAGGNNPTRLPTPEGDIFVPAICSYAADTGTVATYLKHIPNQPFTFTQDPDNRRKSEDALIAYTWRRFIEETPDDPEILLRMPMTKATVRAMDTVTAVTKDKVPDSNVQKYFITGASKRGWTAWTTAAVDRRVIAVAPMVLSVLNLVKNLHHHYRAYGNWSFALRDYYRQNLTSNLDHPNTQKMADIVDPYAYKERLTMPKLIICATGDEFFLPDDSHYFYDELPGPKWMLLMENTNHGLTLAYVRIYEALVAFHKCLMTGTPVPQMRWSRNETRDGGSIILWTDTQPSSISAWSADTVDGLRRDFRMSTRQGISGVFWEETDINIEDIDPEDGYLFSIAYNKPEVGWKGFLINAEFPAPDNTVLDLTTEVNIIPDTLPFPQCQGTACRGGLV